MKEEAASLALLGQDEQRPLFPQEQNSILYQQLIQQGNYSEAAILQSLQDFRPAAQSLSPIIEEPNTISSSVTPRGDSVFFDTNVESTLGAHSETTLKGSWHASVGWGFVLDGNYSAAEAAYRQALRHETSSAESYLGLGMALMFQGKREQAILAYEEALKIQPNNAATLVHLGYAYADRKEEAVESRMKARALFQQASDLGDPFAIFALRGLNETGEDM